jgi:two-component system sensor histidine kinase MprB
LPVSGRAREIARTGRGKQLTDMDVDGTHLRVLTVGVGGRGAVQAVRPLTEVDSVLRRVLVALLMMVVFGIAIAAALGAWVARIALRPIGRFTQRTEALTGNPDLGQRMEVEGGEELARLARSFNTALDALERSVEAQRHLVADASHELRTPIASLRANIQTLEDADRLPPEDRASLRADIVSELDELTALVSDVVELARGAKPGDATDDVRLDLIVTSMAERARRRAADLVLAVETEATVVVGDPERIGRAVSNVLDNAVKYSPPGSTIEVRLAGGELSVRDHGPGFEDDDLPHVFERFYRSDNARAMPGSGLGLSIVRQAAEAHGGTAEVENAPGGGAIVRVRFGEPLASSIPLTES